MPAKRQVAKSEPAIYEPRERRNMKLVEESNNEMISQGVPSENGNQADTVQSARHPKRNTSIEPKPKRKTSIEPKPERNMSIEQKPKHPSKASSPKRTQESMMESQAPTSDPVLHTWEEEEMRKKMKFSRRMLTPHKNQSHSMEPDGSTPKKNRCWECLLCCFVSCTTGFYICCLPIPSHMTRKMAFHPPPRGKFYTLSYTGSDGRLVLVDSAKKAFGHQSIKLEPKVDNMEMEYFTKLAMLNSETFVIKSSSKNFLVCLWLKSSATHNTVILYAQANAVDLGLFAQMDINFRDISNSLEADVYSFDYSGYGYSSGKPSEKVVNQDIRSVYDHICNTRPDAKVVLLGYSMGTAAVIDLAYNLALKHPNRLAGVVLIAAFTSGCRLLRAKPNSKRTWCCDPFPSVDKAKLIDVPTLLIHGFEDEMVPMAHSVELHKHLRNAVRPLYMKRATHSDILCQKYPEVLDRIRRFIYHEIK